MKNLIYTLVSFSLAMAPVTQALAETTGDSTHAQLMSLKQVYDVSDSTNAFAETFYPMMADSERTWFSDTFKKSGNISLMRFQVEGRTILFKGGQTLEVVDANAGRFKVNGQEIVFDSSTTMSARYEIFRNAFQKKAEKTSLLFLLLMDSARAQGGPSEGTLAVGIMAFTIVAIIAGLCMEGRKFYARCEDMPSDFVEWIIRTYRVYRYGTEADRSLVLSQTNDVLAALKVTCAAAPKGSECKSGIKDFQAKVETLKIINHRYDAGLSVCEVGKKKNGLPEKIETCSKEAAAAQNPAHGKN